jgi:hypothetical protein
MEHTVVKTILFGLGFFSLIACSAPTKEGPNTKEPSKTQTAAYDCQEHQDKASKRLSEVVSSHLTCSADADCVSIGLQTACSDQCNAPINQEGAKLLPTAISTINAEACVGYEDAKCTLTHPPCVPPAAPKCVENKCQ